MTQKVDQRAINHLRTLIKRRDFLKARIEASPKDLSYDKQETAALTWAIEQITKNQDQTNVV